MITKNGTRTPPLALALLSLVSCLALMVIGSGCGGGLENPDRNPADLSRKKPPRPPGGDDPLTNPALAFIRGDGTSSDVWLMTADGSVQEQITNPLRRARDRGVTWSPDGEQLALLRQPDKRWVWMEVYTLQPDGSGLTRIYSADSYTLSVPQRENLDWSPQGDKLLYTPENQPDPQGGDGWPIGVSDLALLDLNGTYQHLGLDAYTYSMKSGAFSPVDLAPGTPGFQGLIAFSARRLLYDEQGHPYCGDNHEIQLVRVGEEETAEGWVVNLVGEPVVMEMAGDQYNPTFAPDGQRLFFRDERSGNPDPIMVVDLIVPDNGPPTWGAPAEWYSQVQWHGLQPTCSPDGQWLVFTDFVGVRKGGGTDMDLFRVQENQGVGDPASEVNLTTNNKYAEGGAKWNPAWSNDL